MEDHMGTERQASTTAGIDTNRTLFATIVKRLERSHDVANSSEVQGHHHGDGDQHRQIVVGLFDTASRAMVAFDSVRDRGIDGDDIGLIANNVTGECDGCLDDAGRRRLATGVVVPGCEAACAGLGCGYVGVTTGSGVIGSIMVVVPPVGTVYATGSIVLRLIHNGRGGPIRSMSVLFLRAGLPIAPAHAYAEGLRRGGALLLLRSADGDTARDARRLFSSYGAVDIAARARDWRRSGWYEFEPEDRPFTRDEILLERQRNGVLLPVVAPPARARSPRAAQQTKKPTKLRRVRRENAADGMSLTAAVVVG